MRSPACLPAAVCQLPPARRPDGFALHQALILDFYGALLYHWGWSYRDVPQHRITLDARRVSTLEGLRAELARRRAEWGTASASLADGLFGRGVRAEVVRRAGRFRLVRFCTGFDPAKITLQGEHLGEALIDADERLLYLKTYRLDRGQARRGDVLSRLAAAGWDPAEAARQQGHGRVQRVLQDLDAAGLGYLVRPDWRRIAERELG